MSTELNTKSIVWTAIAGTFTILVGTNAFFIKGLVDKIERVSIIEDRLDVLETKIDLFIQASRK